MTDTITLPRAVINDAIESLQGYARETGDTQPCDAEKALRAALTEALAHDVSFISEGNKAQQGWQPIETAPKDGTVILMFRNKEVLAGAFHAELGKYPWLILEESMDGTNGLQEGAHGPTHWMPLPSAPKGVV